MRCEFQAGCAAHEGHETSIDAMKLLAQRCPSRKFDCCQKLVNLFEQEYKADQSAGNGERLIDMLMNTISVGEREHRFEDALAMCRRAQAVAAAIKSSKSAYIKQRLGPLAARDESIKAIAAAEETLKDNWQHLNVRPKLAMLYLTQMDDPARAVKISGLCFR